MGASDQLNNIVCTNSATNFLLLVCTVPEAEYQKAISPDSLNGDKKTKAALQKQLKENAIKVITDTALGSAKEICFADSEKKLSSSTPVQQEPEKIPSTTNLHMDFQIICTPKSTMAWTQSPLASASSAAFLTARRG